MSMTPIPINVSVGREKSMKLKPVFTWSSMERCLRLFRITWVRGVVGDGNGYSAKLSLALEPRLFSYVAAESNWIVTFIGVRVHYARSYGGIFA